MWESQSFVDRSYVFPSPRYHRLEYSEGGFERAEEVGGCGYDCVTPLRRRNFSRPFRSGWPAVPPTCCVDRAPQALPSTRHPWRSRPERKAWTKPAAKESPAPVVSTGRTLNGGAETTWPSAAAMAPRGPSLTTTQGALSANSFSASRTFFFLVR